MSDLRDLYQDLILDHTKRPRNFGQMENANCRADGHNPLCGDKLTVFLDVDNGVVKDVRRLTHLHHKRALAARKIVACADASEDAIHQIHAGFSGR